MHDDFHRLLQAQPFIFHQTAHIMRRHYPNKKLSMPSTRDPAGGIVSVGTCSDHRAVSNPAIFFIGHPTRTGGRRNVTLLIAGDGSYGTKLLIPHKLFEPLMGMVERIGVRIPDRFPLVISEL